MEQIPLPINRPRQPGEFDFGETAPIVSSCAICNTSLPLHNVRVMADGEHVCANDINCHDQYVATIHENSAERVVCIGNCKICPHCDG